MEKDKVLKETSVAKSALYELGALIEETKDEEFEELLKEEKSKSYLRGKEEGELFGYEKGHKELDALFPLLRSIAQKLLMQKEQIVLQVKREIIDFSIAICEKILRSELSQKEKLAKIIDSYLTPHIAEKEEGIKIFLAAEDLVMLRSQFEEKRYDEVHFMADTQLQRGDFRIVTKTSLLNCTLSRQLEDLRSKIMQ